MSRIQQAESLYGFTSPLAAQTNPPIISKRTPTTTDYAAIGTIWIYPAGNAAYILVSIVSNVATWNLLEASAGAGVFSSLVVTPGPITLTGTTNVNTSGASAVNIGTGTYTGTITLGNSTHASTVNILAPTIDLDGPAAGTITIGDSITTGSVSIATGLTSGSVTIGAVAGIVDIFGNLIDIDSDAAGAITIGNSITSGSIVMGSSLTTGGISIGSNAAATVTTDIYSGNTGGIIIKGGTGTTANVGNVQIVPGVVTSAAASATLNQRVGVAIFTGFTTAGAGKQAFTIVNSNILTTSFVNVTVANLNASTNGALMGIQGVTQAAGSIVVSCINNAAGALGAGDNVLISWVVNS